MTVLINKILTAKGLEVRRKPQVLVRSPHDLQLTFEFAAAHLAARSPGKPLTLVQVGAFDGSANDPVLDALGRFGWRAALIEPQRTPFEALRALHGDNADIQLFNVAISAEDGVRDLYSVDPHPDLPGFVQQLASFDRSHIEKAHAYLPPGTNLDPLIRTTPVEAWTFETLLARASFSHVDILQIDAEGYDYELLKLFDIAGRLPTIVNYEHMHLSRADRDSAASLLVASGYRLAMSYAGGDTVAYRQPAAG
jgi:FkbM family methyltransferase